MEILQEPTQDAYAEFDAFVQKYDQAIWRAWYVTTEPPANKLLDFILAHEIAEGAFGKVYRATREGSTEPLAVKILHPDIRRNSNKLQSFRRGVRSMEILSTSDIEGMIPYKEASEIPAFAVMEYIDGPNLHSAVRSGDLSDWTDILRIATELAQIIDSAHKLPERVLHRDIRPANIMLRNFYRGATDYEVLVLDFDLSWHRGAFELSVMSVQSANGFLAPEQVMRSPSVSTRHASVDSFGLGMTFYFLRSGLEPVFAQHRHADWRDVLRDSIASVPCAKWKSLPQRFARLVEVCTRDSQSARWDLPQIANELDRLREAELDPSKVTSAELLAEELACNTGIENRYEWDEDHTRAIYESHGTTFSFKGIESLGIVQADFSWSRKTGPKVGKFLKPKAEKCITELKRGKWKATAPDIHEDVIRIRATVPVSVLQRGFADALTAVTSAMDAFEVH